VCNVAVILAVDAMARLQQAWGSGVTSWTGKDPCGGLWQDIICSGNRVISLYSTLFLHI
jgi:hypothetical protein